MTFFFYNNIFAIDKNNFIFNIKNPKKIFNHLRK